jgi:hypothetical protein
MGFQQSLPRQEFARVEAASRLGFGLLWSHTIW